MKSKILKTTVLILSTFLLLFAIIFGTSKDRVVNKDLYDDTTGIRLPKNMANVQEIMTYVLPLSGDYSASIYFDDEQGERDGGLYYNYHGNEKIVALFEAIDSETWYYIDENVDKSINIGFKYFKKSVVVEERVQIDIVVYANCMYIAYYQEDQNLKARYVAPEDGESDVYEIMLAIVNDFKTQTE